MFKAFGFWLLLLELITVYLVLLLQYLHFVFLYFNLRSQFLVSLVELSQLFFKFCQSDVSFIHLVLKGLNGFREFLELVF